MKPFEYKPVWQVETRLKGQRNNVVSVWGIKELAEQEQRRYLNPTSVVERVARAAFHTTYDCAAVMYALYNTAGHMIFSRGVDILQDKEVVDASWDRVRQEVEAKGLWWPE